MATSTSHSSINFSGIADACERVYHRSTDICGVKHGSSWLFDKLVRYFDKEPAAVSVSVPVTLSFIGPGVCTIGRDGSLITQTAEAYERYGV